MGHLTRPKLRAQVFDEVSESRQDERELNTRSPRTLDPPEVDMQSPNGMKCRMRLLALLLAPTLSIGCRDGSVSTEPLLSRRLSADTLRGPNRDTYVVYDCTETIFDDGSTIQDCTFSGYDTSDESVVPSYYSDACVADAEACFTGGEEDITDGVWNGGMSLIDAGLGGCAPSLCVHISGYTDPLMIGCPSMVYEGDPAGPHGPEYWTMYLGRKGFNALAMATQGYYTGRSVINGFVWSMATATVWCDVGYGVFKGAHP